MYLFTVPMRDEDKQDFSDMRWALSKKLPLYLDITNGLVDNFNVSDPFKDTLHIGFIYLDYDNETQSIFIDDKYPASNVALDVLDDIIKLGEEEYKKNVDIKYVFDPDTLEVNVLLVLRVGTYGVLLEDLYSLYFTGETIRNYGFNKNNYETHGEYVSEKAVKSKASFLNVFRKNIFRKKKKNNE